MVAAAKSIVAIACFILLSAICINAALHPLRNFTKPLLGGNAADRLILNDYLPENSELARNLSKVNIDNKFDINMGNAGYINIDKVYNSNTFFWVFPAQSGDMTAPLLIWMNGGPGATSMYGLFEEMGPFSISADGSTVIPRPFSWNTNYAMLFIDNPVGTGFSYTDNSDAFVRNQTMVGNDLYLFLEIFYSVYSEYLKVPLYVTGESYAGKYVPAISYKIWQMNQGKPAIYIPLTGLSIGDGLMDPITQIPGYSDLLFNEGLASPAQYQIWKALEEEMEIYILEGQTILAFEIFDALLNGDFYPYPTYFFNTTGLTDYFNLNQPNYPGNGWQTWINTPAIRKQLHVGDQAFWSYNHTVEFYLIGDWFVSVSSYVQTLLNANYKVLVYNGQNDIILSSPQCLTFLNQLPWVGLIPWQVSPRVVWQAANDTGISGYAQAYGNFTYVLVRQAGHLLPQDQPLRAFDMITKFISGTSFGPTQEAEDKFVSMY